MERMQTKKKRNKSEVGLVQARMPIMRGRKNKGKAKRRATKEKERKERDG